MLKCVICVHGASLFSCSSAMLQISSLRDPGRNSSLMRTQSDLSEAGTCRGWRLIRAAPTSSSCTGSDWRAFLEPNISLSSSFFLQFFPLLQGRVRCSWDSLLRLGLLAPPKRWWRVQTWWGVHPGCLCQLRVSVVTRGWAGFNNVRARRQRGGAGLGVLKDTQKNNSSRWKQGCSKLI